MRTAMKFGLAALLLSLVTPILASADQQPAPSQTSKDDQIARFVGTHKGLGFGKPALILDVRMPPDSTQVTKLLIPNEDPMGNYHPSEIATKVIGDTKPGDLLTIKTQSLEGVASVSQIGKYEAKPGEDEPNSFIFLESGGDADHPTVSLSRFGQVGVLAVATKNDDTGKMAPDADAVAAIATFKKGDVVVAKLKPGRIPALVSIEAYTAPLTGTFVSIINSTVVDGQPHPAIDIKTDAGLDTIIFLPGTTNKAGKWTVDPDLFRAVHHLHAKSPIQYRTSGSGDQAVLKDITVGKAVSANS